MLNYRSITGLTKHVLRSFLFWAVAGLVVGYFAASIFIPRPQVAIISLSGSITREAVTDEIRQMLTRAKEDRAIRAAVLEINSGGGSAPLSEDIYWQVIDLRREKPVVVHIQGQALSGAYQIAVASDYIYAEATSMVGNVGAWTRFPDTEEPSEKLVPTGPFKETGNSSRGMMAWLVMVKESFLKTVMVMRGDKLTLRPEELAKAAIYLGVEGVQYGLIDDIGSSGDAIKKAASIAALRHYEVIDLRKTLQLTPVSQLTSFPVSQEGLPDSPRRTLPEFYYEYPSGDGS